MLRLVAVLQNTLLSCFYKIDCLLHNTSYMYVPAHSHRMDNKSTIPLKSWMRSTAVAYYIVQYRIVFSFIFYSITNFFLATVSVCLDTAMSRVPACTSVLLCIYFTSSDYSVVWMLQILPSTLISETDLLTPDSPEFKKSRSSDRTIAPHWCATSGKLHSGSRGECVSEVTALFSRQNKHYICYYRIQNLWVVHVVISF